MPSGLKRRDIHRGVLAGAFAVAASRPAKAATTTLVLSHHLPTSHLVHRTSERFAALVDQGSGGQIAIDVKPGGQLFNLRSGTEALRLGTLDLCWSDFGTLGNWRPEFGFISLPFLFSGFDQVKKVLYGPLGARVTEDAKKSLAIEILALGASGFRVFLGSKRIVTADDCKGIKLRVPEVPAYVEMARALGANPTPIPADGIYTSLQTHVVDMIENPPDYIVDTKLWEVGPHACRTNHIFTDISLMASARKLASLPQDVTTVLRNAARQAIEQEMWETNYSNQEKAWASLASHTDAVAEPDRDSFRARTRPVVERFIARNATAKAYVDDVMATA